MAVPSNEAPAAAASGALTPAMRQYHDAKRQYRDAIVFFRMGDFYEMFFEDALVASRALELTLTSRSKDPSGGAIPMCGVPFHAVDGYLARLVRKGYRVAICDQVEDPKKAKGVVRREVTRVVSPGTLLDANYLDAREPAFMMSLGPDRGDRIGAALLDLTTGEFTVAEYAGPSRWQAIDDELRVLAPRELVVPAGLEIAAMAPEVTRASIPVTTLDDWQFDADRAKRTLSDQLRAASLDGFGLSERVAAIQAAGGLVAHLRDTQKADLAHVRTIGLRQQADYLLVDPTTIKHLGVVEGTEGGRAGSLLDELDATVTSMGGRLLRSWLLRPLLLLEPIRDRLDAVEELAFRGIERAKFR